jgi:S-adenosylmethionine decarboxylase proenzyme
MPDLPLSFLARQLTLDLYDCTPACLNDLDFVRAALQNAAHAIGATVVQTVLHRFSPQGVSGVVVIAESHLAIHTWPEHGYAAVDLFTCGNMDMSEGVQLLIAEFGAGRHHIRVDTRGGEL